MSEKKVFFDKAGAHFLRKGGYSKIDAGVFPLASMLDNPLFHLNYRKSMFVFQIIFDVDEWSKSHDN